MSLSEEFIAEVDTAVEQVALDIAPADKAVGEPKSGDDLGKPAAETVVEHEDDDNEPVNDDGSQTADDGAEVKDEPKAGDEPKPAAPAAPTISDDVLTRAVQAGIPVAMAREYGSDARLLQTIQLVEQAAKKADPKSEEKADEDPLAGLPKLDPENYEPEVIKSFETLVAVVRKQQEAIKSFQAQSEQFTRAGNETAAHEVERWFDTKIQSLGEDFQDALGTGTYGSLNRGSPQCAKRDALASQVAVLLAGYKAAGLQAPPRDEVFDAAARIVLKDEFQKVHDKKLAGDLAKRGSQHIQRAGGRKGKNEQNPLEEAAAAIDEKFFSKK